MLVSRAPRNPGTIRQHHSPTPNGVALDKGPNLAQLLVRLLVHVVHRPKHHQPWLDARATVLKQRYARSRWGFPSFAWPVTQGRERLVSLAVLHPGLT